MPRLTFNSLGKTQHFSHYNTRFSLFSICQHVWALCYSLCFSISILLVYRSWKMFLIKIIITASEKCFNCRSGPFMHMKLLIKANERIIKSWNSKMRVLNDLKKWCLFKCHLAVVLTWVFIKMSEKKNEIKGMSDKIKCFFLLNIETLDAPNLLKADSMPNELNMTQKCIQSIEKRVSN